MSKTHRRPGDPVGRRASMASIAVTGAALLFALASLWLSPEADSASTGTAPQLGPNLVVNGSFEKDANKDGRPDGWTIEWMWVKSPNRVELATDTAAEGQRSLHVVVTETRVPQGWGGRAFQDIRITPGTTYRVSGSIKMKGWQSLTAVEGVAITALGHFTDGSWSEPQKPITQELFAGDFDWKRFEGRITAPAGADRLRLAVWANTGTGEIWFDDIRLQAELAETEIGEEGGQADRPAGQEEGSQATTSTQQGTWSLTLKPRPVEARAVWIDEYTLASLTGRESVARLMDQLQQAGINMVFPFVWMGGYALWQSEVATVSAAVEVWGEDPLQVMVEEAHRRGIEIHPVAVIFMVGSKSDPGPIATAHPDWVELDRNGNSVSSYDLIWVSPALPEVQDFVMSVLKEMVSKYDIDGLQLDYIRYELALPTPFGYNPRALARYKEETGVDARQLTPGSEGELAFASWRTEQVTRFVERAHRELKAIKPHLLLSADVDPDYRSALSMRYQDWKLWVEKGYLDLVFPMAYSTNVNEVRNWMKNNLYLNGLASGKALVYAGIGSYLLRTPEQIVEQVELVRELGVPGNALFCTLQLESWDYDALASGPYRYPAVPPHRAPGAAAAATVRALADQVKAAEGAPAPLVQDFDHLATRIEKLAEAPSPPTPAEIDSIRSSLTRTIEDLQPGGRLGRLIAEETAAELRTELTVADQILLYWSFHPGASK
ncbi:MAG: family 10 glycosylhydrolase [Limnochordales bacterium]|nr:family 10 glycosylhydrolase [Limnochordales bacterium]